MMRNADSWVETRMACDVLQPAGQQGAQLDRGLDRGLGMELGGDRRS
jgi:hypothetical protein